jgi:hypothetical protein
MECLAAPTSPPGTYADWCDWADALEAGTCDAELLRLAALSTTIWTAAVARMFSTRTHDALNARLNRAGRRLERKLGACRDEASVSLALAQARHDIQALARFAECVTFPDALREGLRNLVDHHARTRQEALEKSARADPSGRLALAVRRTPLHPQPCGPDLPPRQSGPDAEPPIGRRIIMDQPSS